MGEAAPCVAPEEVSVGEDAEIVLEEATGGAERPVLAVAGGSEGLPDPDAPIGLIVPLGPGTRLVLL